MAKVLQHRRGTTAENDAFTGAVGEITVDTDLHRLRLHDGQKQGGYEVGTVQTVNEQLPDDNGNVNISGVPVGTIIWSAVPNAPHGFLVCDGSIVGRATYPELFAAIGTTYGAGDGSTTFALPNLIGKVAWGDANVGIEKAAGLPNITGAVGGALYPQNGVGNSALFTSDYVTKTVTNAWTAFSQNDAGSVYAQFNASRSNSIYGNSDTVQPPALTLLPCIKAYEAVVDDGTVVVSELARDVDRKDEVVESGDGYVRYSNGLQICWGEFSILNSDTNGWNGDFTINTPKSFRDLAFTVTTSSGVGDSGWQYTNGVGIGGISSVASFWVRIAVGKVTNYPNVRLHWHAFGYWK